MTTRNKTLFPAVFESASVVTTKTLRRDRMEQRGCQTRTNRGTNVEQNVRRYEERVYNLGGDFEKFPILENAYPGG